MKKHVPVTDMTFGQLYDAVASGEEFYANSEKIYLSHVTGMIETKTLNSDGVYFEFCKNKIKKEKPWTDQLDGSWDNGVWCMCSDEEYPFFEKVVSYTPDVKYKFDFSTGSIARTAKPVPKDLADQLEAFSKEVQG